MSTYSNFAPYPDGHAKVEKENNLPCLVSASASDIPEVLFAVEPETVDVAKEAGEFNINMTCKNEGFEINPSVDWITLKGMTSTNGEYVVTFACAENTEAARTGAIEFTSGEETITVTVNQAGAIAEVTVAEAIASGELCSVLGKVIFTHSKGVLITDGRDVLYGYLGAAPEVAVDDVVKMVGAVTQYNGGRSMNKPVVAKAEGTVGTYRTPAPVVLDAEKFAAYTSADADFATPYVMITGVAETDDYNNLIVKLVDGETTYSVKSYYANESYADWAGKEVKAYGYAYNAYADSKQVNVLVTSVMDAAAEGPQILTLTNAEILAALAAANSTSTSYVDYTIESASGVWAVNASQLNTNTFLQCRGKKGSYIKTPAFDKDIKSVTIHFTTAKSVYANNVYCAFPATWTAPTEDAQYPETGNVGKATTDGSYSLTIPVAAGNKQVYVSIIGTYSYYLDHIDVEL